MCEIGGIARSLYIASGLGKGLTHLAGHLKRDLIFSLNEQITDHFQIVAPCRSGNAAPGCKRTLRGVYGIVDIDGKATREKTDHLGRPRRVTFLIGLAGRGIHPLPADVVLIRFAHDADKMILCAILGQPAASADRKSKIVFALVKASFGAGTGDRSQIRRPRSRLSPPRAYLRGPGLPIILTNFDSCRTRQ